MKRILSIMTIIVLVLTIATSSSAFTSHDLGKVENPVATNNLLTMEEDGRDEVVVIVEVTVDDEVQIYYYEFIWIE